MKIVKKYSPCVLFLFVFSLLLPAESYGWPWQRPRAAARPATTPHTTTNPRPRTSASQTPQSRPKTSVRSGAYEYVREHDYNHDGKVDSRDRAIWLERYRSGGVPNVLVSKENEDILEIMDIDNNGNVDAEEMEIFYQKYDLNNNGVLETEEINAAID